MDKLVNIDTGVVIMYGINSFANVLANSTFNLRSADPLYPPRDRIAY